MTDLAATEMSVSADNRNETVTDPAMDNLEAAKYNMVEQQIRPWNVLDRRILDTIMAESRERFVPYELLSMAFADMNLPIGDGQVMMQPNVEARLLQALQPQSDESVLEIGTGTGYMTALLAKLANFVQTVEIREQLAEFAHANLSESRIGNVDIFIGDGAQGWDAGFSPDCIVLSGSVPRLPDFYKNCLAVGGRLVAIVGSEPIMNAVVVQRVDENAWNTTSLFETCLPPLDHVNDEREFEF